MDTRIPIEDFDHFPSCRMVGETFGRRYEFFCEAFQASLQDAEQRLARTPDPRQVTIARRGREPREYTALQHAVGEQYFQASPWGGRVG